MRVKFKNIGRNNVSFTKEAEQLTESWLLKQVRPYLLSHNIDFIENRKGTITVLAGFQTVGEIELEKG